MDIRILRFNVRIETMLLGLFLMLFAIPGLAQEVGPEHYDEDGNLIVKKTGFFTGIYVGSYWPNHHSSSLYDGYGFDFEENRNTYENSWMYEKIHNQYGGGYGQPDYIGEALGVQPGEWSFDESDMPENIRFKTAWLVGVSGRYTLDQKNAIMFNVEGAILKAVGNFTISTLPPPNSTQVNNSIRTYEISGEEQRLIMQAGFQHLFGEPKAFNLYVEGGLHATLAKFENNEILIEYLRINLYDEYYDAVSGASYYNAPEPVGLGFGAFGGAGVNIDTNSKWSLQIAYNFMLENIRIGYDQKIKPANAIGLRAYYTLFSN